MSAHDEKPLQMSKNNNKENTRVNSTNYLLEDSFGISTGKNPYSMSVINKRFNNTQNLLHDKTSILLENVSKRSMAFQREIEAEDYLKTSLEFDTEKKLSIINHQKNTSDKENKLNHSLLSLSEESMISHKNSNLFLNTNNTENKAAVYLLHSEEVSIDKKVLNFGTCFPGEKTSLILKLKNNSKTEQKLIDVKISFDKNIQIYFKSITGDNSFKIENSILKYDCFSLQQNEIIFENKVLIKGNEEKEINVFVNSPFVKNLENIYGVVQIFMNNEVISNVPIISTIEIPKLLCLKEMRCPESKFPLISIMLEIKSKGQKFRIPFKNLSNKDMDIELSIDTKNNNSIFLLDDILYECQFVFFPNVLNAGSHATSSIDLIAKIKRIKMDENTGNIKTTPKTVRKILIAKIKNTTVHYSFFIEAHFKRK